MERHRGVTGKGVILADYKHSGNLLGRDAFLIVTGLSRRALKVYEKNGFIEPVKQPDGTLCYTAESAAVVGAMMKCLDGQGADLGEAYETALRAVAAKKRRTDSPAWRSGGENERFGTISPREVKKHPTFENLLTIGEDLLEMTIRDMSLNGYYESEPVVLGTWCGQEKPVLIDGHMRIRAAIEARIAQVPFVVEEFSDETAALHHALNLQTERRRTSDGALYRLCEQFDRLMERGRKKGDAKELMTSVSHFTGPSASARRTAALIGCHYRKVDKIRKVRKDGTPQIREDVRNDKMSINMAYNLIRKMQQGEEENSDKSAAERIEAAKTLLTEENFARLEELDGDIRALLNRAVELYLARMTGSRVTPGA